MTQQDSQWSNLFMYKQIKDAVEEMSKTVDSKDGASGIRYYNDKLQIQVNGNWVDIPLDEFHLST